MRSFTFEVSGLAGRGSERRQRRRLPRRHGPRGLKARLSGLGVAKGGLLAAAAVVGAAVAWQSARFAIKVSGPVETVAGLKWELRATVPKRLRQIALVVNGKRHVIAVTNGRLREQLDLLPGRNTIKAEGTGQMISNQTTVTVPADKTQMGCDCAHAYRGRKGLAGSISDIADQIAGSCRDTEEKLKAGTVKWCDPAAMGPKAWPKAP